MRGTKVGSVCLVGALVGALGIPMTPASAATALPQDAVLTVPGHGWGHGRGLGQWGARGYAEQGKSYGEILSHYYSNTTLGGRTIGEDIRVLVETSPDNIVTSASPFTVKMGSNVVATSNTSAKFMRGTWDGSKYLLHRATSHTGPWTYITSSTAYPVFVPGDSMLELVFAGGSVRLYRGQIHSRYATDGMRAINVLPLESYLYGVVPSEMPSSWPTQALRAQSTAARTYAIYKKVNARANGTVFDICATTQCQVYAGYGSRTSPTGSVSVNEQSATNSAIDVSAGRVVLYSGNPILAEFSSSTGGYTAPGTVAYQKAVADAGDAISPHHDWRAEITVKEVENRWPQIGRLTGIQITSRDGYGEWGGRVKNMRLEGTSASIDISGSAWRSAFAWPGRANGVRGTFFTVLLNAGSLISAPSKIELPLGSSTDALVRIKNTGTGDWPVGGTFTVGTNGASDLANEDWISTSKASSVTRNVSDKTATKVKPGQTAEFSVPLTATQIGTFTESFLQFANTAAMAPRFNLTLHVLPPWVDDGANLLSNGSFDEGSLPWRFVGTAGGDGSSLDLPRHSGRSLRLRNGGSKAAVQRVVLAGGSSRSFTFGGWSRTVSTSTSGGAIDLRARVHYTDGGDATITVPFSRASHDWTYNEATFMTSASRTLSYIEITARSNDQSGTSYFDAIRLHETPVSNDSFEAGTRNWARSGSAAGDGVTMATARDGYRSMVFTGTGAAKTARQSFRVAARKTGRFAFSYWHRADGLANAGAATITLSMRAPNGTEYDQVFQIPKTQHDWAMSEFSVKAPVDITSAAVTIRFSNPQGKLFVDAVRLTRTFTVDPSMEKGGAWSTYGSGASFTTVDEQVLEGAKSASIQSGAGRRGLVQQVAVASGPKSLFRIQGWYRSQGLASSGGFVGFVVAFRNKDGSTTGVRVPVRPGSTPWTFVEATVHSTKLFAGIDIYAQANDRTGKVNFDAIRFERY